MLVFVKYILNYSYSYCPISLQLYVLMKDSSFFPFMYDSLFLKSKITSIIAQHLRGRKAFKKSFEIKNIIHSTIYNPFAHFIYHLNTFRSSFLIIVNHVGPKVLIALIMFNFFMSYFSYTNSRTEIYSNLFRSLEFF